MYFFNRFLLTLSLLVGAIAFNGCSCGLDLSGHPPQQPPVSYAFFHTLPVPRAPSAYGYLSPSGKYFIDNSRNIFDVFRNTLVDTVPVGYETDYSDRKFEFCSNAKPCSSPKDTCVFGACAKRLPSKGHPGEHLNTVTFASDSSFYTTDPTDPRLLLWELSGGHPRLARIYPVAAPIRFFHRLTPDIFIFYLGNDTLIKTDSLIRNFKSLEQPHKQGWVRRAFVDKKQQIVTGSLHVVYNHTTKQSHHKHQEGNSFGKGDTMDSVQVASLPSELFIYHSQPTPIIYRAPLSKPSQSTDSLVLTERTASMLQACGPDHFALLNGYGELRVVRASTLKVEFSKSITLGHQGPGPVLFSCSANGDIMAISGAKGFDIYRRY